jgi:hypothetical protein
MTGFAQSESSEILSDSGNTVSFQRPGSAPQTLPERKSAFAFFFLQQADWILRMNSFREQFSRHANLQRAFEVPERISKHA